MDGMGGRAKPAVTAAATPSYADERALIDELQQVRRLIDPLVLFPGGFAWELHIDISVR
jgi:hypothetical protein